jgi:hypothetical protein
MAEADSALRTTAPAKDTSFAAFAVNFRFCPPKKITFNFFLDNVVPNPNKNCDFCAG